MFYWITKGVGVSATPVPPLCRFFCFCFVLLQNIKTTITNWRKPKVLKSIFPLCRTQWASVTPAIYFLEMWRTAVVSGERKGREGRRGEERRGEERRGEERRGGEERREGKGREGNKEQCIKVCKIFSQLFCAEQLHCLVTPYNIWLSLNHLEFTVVSC